MISLNSVPHLITPQPFQKVKKRLMRQVSSESLHHHLLLKKGQTNINRTPGGSEN